MVTQLSTVKVKDYKPAKIERLNYTSFSFNSATEYTECSHSNNGQKYICTHDDCCHGEIPLNCYECLTISHMNNGNLKDHISLFKTQESLEKERAAKQQTFGKKI